MEDLLFRTIFPEDYAFQFSLTLYNDCNENKRKFLNNFLDEFIIGLSESDIGQQEKARR